jgi:hypothetical protein
MRQVCHRGMLGIMHASVAAGTTMAAGAAAAHPHRPDDCDCRFMTPVRYSVIQLKGWLLCSLQCYAVGRKTCLLLVGHQRIATVAVNAWLEGCRPAGNQPGSLKLLSLRFWGF